jgi:hypothetical protein
MVNFYFESSIDNIEAFKPRIPGNLVSSLTPDVFLFIKSRLIRRKVLQTNLSMASNEKPDIFSLVPSSPIHKEMDDITTELFEHMPQHLYKSLLVTFGGAYQAFLSYQGCYPARQVEPLAMLAGGGNFESLTFLSPASSKARMQAKASFILKNNRFIVFKLEQFFLTPGENGGHLWHELADKHSQLFSGCNPGNATSIAPAALSTLSQTLSLSELPELAHPSWLWQDQIPEEIFPDSALTVSSQMVLVESAVLAEVDVSETQSLSDSLREPSSTTSCGLDQTRNLSIPDAGPPKPAIRRQFLAQPMPLGFALPCLIAFLGLFRFVLCLKLSWLKHNTSLVNVQIFSAFVLITRKATGC